LLLDIHNRSEDIPIEPWNLCKVLANIIDNAITALADTGKDKRIYVEIGENNSHYTFIRKQQRP
jgi:sensor histidine kinase regulating citrate/malate metabolism